MYLAAGFGVGVGYSGPKLSKVADAAKELLSSGSYSGMSFTNAVATTPFNFRDLDGATCELRSAGGGVGVGYSFATMTVRGQPWYRLPSGKPMFGMRDFLKNVNVGGQDLQLGVGGTIVGGPLVKVS